MLCDKTCAFFFYSLSLTQGHPLSQEEQRRKKVRSQVRGPGETKEEHQAKTLEGEEAEGQMGVTESVDLKDL